MRIKAYGIKEEGGKAEPFYYERNVGSNEVSVKIIYCSIARGDVQIISNDWGDTKFPLVPGHEIVGIVEETGSDVTALKVGDRVGIGYQQEACFECEFCKSGNEQFCALQKVIGVDCYGGLAEHIVVDNRFAFKLPPALHSVNSVPLLSSRVTVYSGIEKAQLPVNSVVGVLGVGGLGQLAIRFLKKMGHQVYAFSHSPQKKEMINQLGAEFILSSNSDSLSTLNKKFDFIISTLNAPYDMDAFLKLLKPQGKFCIVASPLIKQPIALGLLYDYAQRTIYGNYVGSCKNMTDMLDFAAMHHIESDVEVMPFSKMNEAIEKVRTGEVKIRLILENQE
ncbi:NAD(P)-dependent alcohol dehydrogenase [Mucilaginibacter sp. SG564]|uniref:NAD(P)-dependent alcohol dehydrogenase n=1 Tax=Mucilaginibacter sp. SG564 TaxID=2587022 RepID=UPI0015580A81|nr:NAD(P)-dependent alcohol dehydrogenase [Mucilaginibacter sp. SG564]NOW95722.1 D-arabinose 1-dehydrogenase-like Zn-dependent alcohol dehydrogenase [Mucilaginibacter sp. SG564]